MDTGKSRSSILKPQKPRNPLSDLDVVEPVKVESPVTTTATATTIARRRSSFRRVSFASSNFIKEFATDPETNTVVWDTTYEEMVNKSDSTNSSEVTHNPCNKQSGLGIQHTSTDKETVKNIESANSPCAVICSEAAIKIDLVESEICSKNDNRNKKASINFYEEGGEDILSDSSLCESGICENRIIETGNLQNVNVVTVTQQTVEKKQVHTENVRKFPILPDNVPFTGLFSQSRNLTPANKENIPTQSGSCVTAPVLSHRKLCQFATTVVDTISKIEPSAQMENKEYNRSCTTVKCNTVAANNCNRDSVQQFSDFKRTLIENNTMEFTQPLCGFSKISDNKPTFGTTKKLSDESMEFTQQLPVVKHSCDPKNKTIIMDENIEFSKTLPTVNRSPVEDENMEFTQQLPVVKNSNKTIIMDESIEFTQPLLAFESLALNGNNKSLLENDENKSVVGEDNMEFTQQLPIMKTTSALPGFEPVTFVVDSIRKSDLNDDKKRGVVADENMEFTQQLPVIQYSVDSKNKTVKMEESMQFTKSLPAVEPLTSKNVNSINKSHVNENKRNTSTVADENMEFTQQLPVFQYSVDPRNKTVKMEETMQFTKSLPAVEPLTSKNVNSINKSHVNENKRNTSTVADENMEFTQQLPVFQYSVDPKNKTVKMEETMQFTKSLPAVEPLTSKNVNSINKSHVNENKRNTSTVADENMEFTQQLPVFQYSVDPKNKTVKMEESMQFTKSLRAVEPLTSKNVNSINKSHVNENKSNTSTVADENMEFTQQLPVFQYSVDPKNKTVKMEESMQFTKSLPAVEPLTSKNVNSINKYHVNENKSNTSTVADENMEFTQQLPVFQYSVDPKNKTVKMEESMQFTKSLPAVEPLTTKNVNSINKSHVNENKSNTSTVADENMEFTQQLPVFQYSVDPKNKTVKMEESMQFTKSLRAVEPLTSKNVNSINKSHVNENKSNTSTVADENMEFTQQLPVFQYSVDPKNKTVKMEESMQFTKSLPAVEPLTSKNVNSINKYHVNENKSNTSTVADENMEFTQQLPVFQYSVDPKNKTVKMEESMQFTKSLPAVEPLTTKNVNSINKSHVNENKSNTSTVADENMEFTQQLPVFQYSVDPKNKTVKMEESMQFTKSLPAFEPLTSKNVNSINKSHVNENKRNTSTVADENMEFTQQLPVFQYSVDPKNKTVKMEESLQFTKSLPAVQPLTSKNVNSINKSHVNENNRNTSTVADENMEFTQQLPVFQYSVDPKNKTVKMEESMQFTKSLPAVELLRLNVNSIRKDDKNRSAVTDEYMEFTQQLPVIKLNSDSRNENIETNNQSEENKETSKQNIVCNSLKTPKRSLHSLISFSPGIDDTQHLINCSISSKPPKSDFSKLITGDLCDSFLSPKFMHLSGFGSEAFPVSLETTRNYQSHIMDVEHEELDKDTNSSIALSKEDNINLKAVELKEDKSDIHFEEIQQPVSSTTATIKNINKLKRPSLEKVECATICKKQMLDNTLGKSDENMEISFTDTDSRVVNISQENLTLSDSMASVSNTFTTEAQNIILNITESVVSDTVNISTHQHFIKDKRLQEVSERRTIMQQRMQNFVEKMTEFTATAKKNAIMLEELYDTQLKEISRPFKHRSFEEIKNITDSSADCSFEPTSLNVEKEQSDSDSTMSIEKVVTLKEKIEEKQKECKCYWSALCIEDDNCKFNTLYKTIELTVQFNKETGIVNKVDICCKVSDKIEPIPLFVHNICKNRLSQKVIQSAVGDQYDILTLLDYVYLNMEKMLDILDEFDKFQKLYNLKMDQNFRVTFKIVIVQLLSTWSISVDLLDFENITEDSVTAHAIIGTINEAEIKSFVAGCPPGISFLKSFISNVRGYIDLLKKRRNMKKTNAIDLNEERSFL